MPIQALAPPQRLYRLIADQLEVLIESGEFKPGMRLPAERDLVKKLGVSRPSLREALIALEVAGLVNIRIGSGIYVAERSPKKDERSHKVLRAVPEHEPGPLELVRARLSIESEIAAIAAKTATNVDLAAIRATIEVMKLENQANPPLQDADREFHICIAQATGNTAFVHVVRNLWDYRNGNMWQMLEKHVLTDERLAHCVDEHQAIYEAIEARDPRAARQAMRVHLRSAHDVLSKELQNEKPKKTVKKTVKKAQVS